MMLKKLARSDYFSRQFRMLVIHKEKTVYSLKIAAHFDMEGVINTFFSADRRRKTSFILSYSFLLAFRTKIPKRVQLQI